MRNSNGKTALLIQYFKKGLDVVAKNLNWLLCKINVVIFQLIIKIPVATPTIAMLNPFTFPRYSGARKRESAPKVLIKSPCIALTKMNQKTRSNW